MNKLLLDLYTDYLITSFSYTTSTGLSRLVDQAMSHDKITRFLAEEELTSSDLWQVAKPIVRKIESSDGVILIDDTIEHKPYTDENEMVTWHFDHVKGQAVKGIQIISALYCVGDLAVPIAFDPVKKTDTVINQRTGVTCKKSPVTRNERYRELLRICKHNDILFKYVLNDSWYSSADNMMFIKHNLKKDYIMPIKTNRKIALCHKDKLNGSYVKVDSLAIEPGCTMTIYLEGIDFPMLLIKQIFKNEDGSSGILYLVSSDVTLSYEPIKTIYKKRWKIEEYHKSLKSNLALAKSPTRTVTTQKNHIFACLCAFVKLESLKMETSLNHFALKSKIYLKSSQAALLALQNLRSENTGFA